MRTTTTLENLILRILISSVIFYYKKIIVPSTSGSESNLCATVYFRPQRDLFIAKLESWITGFTTNEEERKKHEATKLITKYVTKKYLPDYSQQDKLIAEEEPVVHRTFAPYYDLAHKKKQQSKAKKVWKSIRNFVYLAFFVFYAMFGGFIFFMIEFSESEKFYNEEKNKTVTLIKERTDKLFSELRTLRCDVKTNETVCKEAIQKELENIATPPKKVEWAFNTSVFYALTTLTTIGYGNITCKSNVGKLVTIFYGALGIPLMVFVLRKNGKVALKSVKKMEVIFCGKKPKKHKTRYRSVSIVSALIYASGFLISTSLIIGVIEQLSVLDSFYFTFQTATTIGFGDITPTNPLTESIVIMFHFISLSLFSMVYAIVQENVEHNYMWALDLIDEEHKKNAESPMNTESTATAISQAGRSAPK